MKFKSATLNVRETVDVVIRSDVTLKVGSLPMGIEREFQNVWPKPTAPFKEIAKVGQPTVKDFNYDDPTFSKQYDDWVYHRNVYYFWRCIEGIDPNVQFASRGDSENGLRAVADELKEAGFSDLDLASVLKASARISTVSEEDVKTAKASFS